MNVSGKIGIATLSLGMIVFGVGAATVSAETVTSPSYRVDGNFGGSFGGQTTSANYKMSAIGGEAIVGDGASGSYMLDQQQTSTAAPTMQLTVQPSGLVGFYPMDENAGTTAADSSRYQNNGTLTGSAAWNAGGKIGAALDPNGPSAGANGSVSVTDHTNLPSGSQMTFEAWINLDDATATSAIAAQWNVGTSWYFSFTNGNLWAAIAPTSSSSIADGYALTSGGVINTAGVWRHVAFVFDGTQAQQSRLQVYVDGTQVASVNRGGTVPASLQNPNTTVHIGSQNGFGAFPGSIDHVKLFDRALRPSEIKAEYVAQNAGMPTGFGLDSTPGTSSTSELDAIVRTNRSYNISVQQDGNLQSGVNSIPAISGSVTSPVAWSEGITKGFGFTLTGAPSLDGKWNSGTNYAAIPSSATSIYDGVGSAYDVIDVVSLKLRLDVAAAQALGTYGNTITYTGTMIP
jgi:hypothetical protein